MSDLAISIYYDYDLGTHVIAKAMNMRSTIRKAYDKALETYDVLIMPTVSSVAPRLPSPNMTISGMAVLP